MPKKALVVRYERVPYERRKVGVNRFYNALQENVEISAVLRVPDHFDVSTQDFCVIDGRQYEIHQVQDVSDTMPPSRDLSLKKTEAEYDITGI
jgi:SPP1 family predicted phage head-tail adaptor